MSTEDQRSMAELTVRSIDKGVLPTTREALLKALGHHNCKTYSEAEQWAEQSLEEGKKAMNDLNELIREEYEFKKAEKEHQDRVLEDIDRLLPDQHSLVRVPETNFVIRADKALQIRILLDAALRDQDKNQPGPITEPLGITDGLGRPYGNNLKRRISEYDSDEPPDLPCNHCGAYTYELCASDCPGNETKLKDTEHNRSSREAELDEQRENETIGGGVRHPKAEDLPVHSSPEGGNEPEDHLRESEKSDDQSVYTIGKALARAVGKERDWYGGENCVYTIEARTLLQDDEARKAFLDAYDAVERKEIRPGFHSALKRADANADHADQVEDERDEAIEVLRSHNTVLNIIHQRHGGSPAFEDICCREINKATSILAKDEQRNADYYQAHKDDLHVWDESSQTCSRCKGSGKAQEGPATTCARCFGSGIDHCDCGHDWQWHKIGLPCAGPGCDCYEIPPAGCNCITMEGFHSRDCASNISPKQAKDEICGLTRHGFVCWMPKGHNMGYVDIPEYHSRQYGNDNHYKLAVEAAFRGIPTRYKESEKIRWKIAEGCVDDALASGGVVSQQDLDQLKADIKEWKDLHQRSDDAYWKAVAEINELKTTLEEVVKFWKCPACEWRGMFVDAPRYTSPSGRSTLYCPECGAVVARGVLTA